MKPTQNDDTEAYYVVMGALTKVASKKKIFKAAEVTEETGGISRQLVYYHLKRMVEKGFLVTYGNGVYADVDLSRIADEMTLKIQAQQQKRPKATKIIPFKSAALLNAKIDFYQAMHGYRTTQGAVADASFIKAQINDEIDESIAMLRSAKKLLNNLGPLSLKGRRGRLRHQRKGVNDRWDAGEQAHIRDWLAIVPEEWIVKLVGKMDNWEAFINDIEYQLEIGKTAPTDDPFDGDQGNQE